MFGYTSYDAIPLFEDIKFKQRTTDEPLLHYLLFRFVLVFNHFNNELYLFEHLLPGQESELDQLLTSIRQRAVSTFPFALKGEETTNFSDEDFLERIEKAKKHVFRGDVFQMVLSRKFSQSYTGDDFNVYRALRSVNQAIFIRSFVCRNNTLHYQAGCGIVADSQPQSELQEVHNKLGR